jgi:MFS-type transporter involved in bile tolerance (Atg22 family)
MAWLGLLVLFVTSGVKSMFRAIKEKMNHESVLYFLIALYLLVASFFYASGVVLFLLAFTFLGDKGCGLGYWICGGRYCK